MDEEERSPDERSADADEKKADERESERVSEQLKGLNLFLSITGFGAICAKHHVNHMNPYNFHREQKTQENVIIYEHQLILTIATGDFWAAGVGLSLLRTSALPRRLCTHPEAPTGFP